MAAGSNKTGRHVTHLNASVLEGKHGGCIEGDMVARRLKSTDSQGLRHAGLKGPIKVLVHTDAALRNILVADEAEDTEHSH